MSKVNVPGKRTFAPPPPSHDYGDDSDNDFLFGAPAALKPPAPKLKQAKIEKKSAPTTSIASTTLQNHEDDEVQLESSTNLPKETEIPWNPFPINQTHGFSKLGISSWLVSALGKMRIIQPTEIQHRCLPAILQGHNVIARAKTGSGKTAAFALPILEKISHDPYGVYALVMTPTRELALQIKEQFDVFGEHIGINTTAIIGGVDMVKQAQQVDNRPHIIIATPGRLADLLNRGSIQNFGADNLKFLVFDEADRLFDDCFVPHLQSIFNHIPPLDSLQVLLFSATITQDVIKAQQQNSKLGQFITKPMYLSAAADDDNIVEKLKQSYLFFPQQVKECYIYYLLQFAVDFDLAQGQKDSDSTTGAIKGNGAKAQRSLADSKDMDDQDPNTRKNQQKSAAYKNGGNNQILAHKLFAKMTNSTGRGGVKSPSCGVLDPSHPTAKHTSCIVFTKTVKTAQFLSLFLREMGIPNVPLHSKVKQAQRIQNLNKFRQGVFKVLIATDVAARGLDIPLVTFVVNYDLPHSPDDYVHRVGRTARANRNGVALTLVTQYDVEKLTAIEEHVNIKLAEFENGKVDEELIIKPLRIITETKKVVLLKVEEMEERYNAQRNQVGKQSV